MQVFAFCTLRSLEESPSTSRNVTFQRHVLYRNLELSSLVIFVASKRSNSTAEVILSSFRLRAASEGGERTRTDQVEVSAVTTPTETFQHDALILATWARSRDYLSAQGFVARHIRNTRSADARSHRRPAGPVPMLGRCSQAICHPRLKKWSGEALPPPAEQNSACHVAYKQRCARYGAQVRTRPSCRRSAAS